MGYKTWNSAQDVWGLNATIDSSKFTLMVENDHRVLRHCGNVWTARWNNRINTPHATLLGLRLFPTGVNNYTDIDVTIDLQDRWPYDRLSAWVYVEDLNALATPSDIVIYRREPSPGQNEPNGDDVEVARLAASLASPQAWNLIGVWDIDDLAPGTYMFAIRVPPDAEIGPPFIYGVSSEVGYRT